MTARSRENRSKKHSANSHIWPKSGLNEAGCGAADRMASLTQPFITHWLASQHHPAISRVRVSNVLKMILKFYKKCAPSPLLFQHGNAHYPWRVSSEVPSSTMHPLPPGAAMRSVLSILWCFWITSLHVFGEIITFSFPPDYLCSCLFPNLFLWQRSFQCISILLCKPGQTNNSWA